MMTPSDFTQKGTHKEREDEEVTLVGDEVTGKEAMLIVGEGELAVGGHRATPVEDGTGTTQECRKGGQVSKRPRKSIKSRIIRAPPILRRSHRLHASDEVRSLNKDGWVARACAQPIFAS